MILRLTHSIGHFILNLQTVCQYVINLLMAQGSIIGLNQIAAVRDLFQKRRCQKLFCIRFHPKLFEVSRQAALFDKFRQCADPSGSQFFFGFAFLRNPPDICRKSCELCRGLACDETVQRRMNDRQALAMVAVSVSPELVLNLMCLKIG